nr:hypothetical protein [Tanacetum cinerariifolium]
MSTQQDIYAASSENHHPMLNKDNYVPWSSRVISYARSRPNGKMIVDSFKNEPYVRQMIATPGEPDLPVPVHESFHVQTDEEQTENDIKRMDADDQAIQTILLGLLKDVYDAVDSYETAKEIWEYVRQMMKGSDIREQEKKAKLFNEWKKHFPENIASNLKFLNNLQLEWKRHVTIVRQTKNLHEDDFTQIYDFLKMNQDENSYYFPTTHNDQSSSSTHSQQSFPINNKYNPQPSLNQNFMQPPMTSLEDINDPTEAMNAALILFAKAFQLTAPTNNNQRTSSNTCNLWTVCCTSGTESARNGLVVVPWITNQNGTGNVVAARAEEEFDFMAAAGDLDEIEEVNANCILMANLQHASISGTQLDKAPIYDTDGSTEVQLNDNCYDNKIFNMFTQEEQYTDLLEPIPEPQLVPQNDIHVTSVAPSMVQSRGTVEISSAPNEETRAHQETIYRNMRATNAELKSELARYKIQEQRIKISQEKYEKLEKCYQKSVYQEQCLTRKINALHLNSAKQITTLNDEISNLNKQLSKEKSSISSLMEEKKRLKHDFKTRKDKFLDKEVDLEAKIKYLDNILLKRNQTVHKIISHEIAPIINQVDAMVQNLKIQFLQEAAKFVRDFKSLAKEVDESLDKQKSLELEIERLLKASVSHDIMSVVQNGFVDVPSDL